MSKLYFRYGAMNCGKTSILLAAAYNYEEKGMKVSVIKPKIDTKGDDMLVARIGLKRKVDFLVDDNQSFKEYLLSCYKNYISCIFVDEANFLSKEHVDELYLFTKKYDIPVICYGLRADFKTEAFTGSARLFELADILEEIVTICDCGKRAKFNAREINGSYVTDGEKICIDGTCDNTKYVSLCGKCYLEKVLKINFKKEKRNK
ncbi:MAG: thymidine kinase [Bacilli bacterium]